MNIKNSEQLDVAVGVQEATLAAKGQLPYESSWGGVVKKKKKNSNSELLQPI